jgi:hypothetical protein
MKKFILAFCLILFPVAVCSEQGILIPKGYWDGYNWKDGKADREAYTRGVVDGMLFASEVERSGKFSLEWLNQCVSGRSIQQIQEAVQHEVDAHPGSLRDGMHMIAFRALLKACPNSPKFTPYK